MFRRTLIVFLILFTGLLNLPGQPLAEIKTDPPPDYGRLLEYIQEQDLTDPLIAFGEIEENFDQKLNSENMAYLNRNEDLQQQIKSHLKGDHLKWQLSNSFQQLLVVPENRDEYARLFEQYCRAAVSHLVFRLNIEMPYFAISTLKGPLPDPPPSGGSGRGITAYLVHNIANEYIEEYLFFDQHEEDIQLKIKLSNREFDGKIGSYSSKLKIGPDHQFEFIHEPFTLWQNSARNPINVFIVPIEETLHIVLRRSTESAMHEELTRMKPEKLDQVKAVIDHWMAVEEAVVGGLVYQIMPELLENIIHGTSAQVLDEAMAERDEHPQYRLLEKGIELVRQLGVEETIALYQNGAHGFESKLLEFPTKIKSAQVSHSPQMVN